MPGQLRRLPSTRMIRGIFSGKTVSKCARKNAFSSSGAAKVMQTTLPSSPTCRSGTPLGAQAVQAIACAPELALGQGRDAGHLLERLQE